MRILTAFLLFLLAFNSIPAFAQGRGSDSEMYKFRKEQQKYREEKKRKAENGEKEEGLPIDLVYSAVLNAGVSESGSAAGGAQVGLKVRKKNKKKNPTEIEKKADEKTSISFELQGGLPVLRFSGQLDVYPIEVYSNIIKKEGATEADAPDAIVQLLVQPVSIEGFATVNRFNKFRDQEVWGKATFTATPEFLLKSMGNVVGSSKSVHLELEIALATGVSAGYTTDEDGESPVVGPRVGFVFAPKLVLTESDEVQLRLSGNYTLNLIGPAGDLMRAKSEINYLHRFDGSNANSADIFVGGVGRYEHIDIPNLIPSLEKNDGKSYFIGGQVGVHF